MHVGISLSGYGRRKVRGYPTTTSSNGEGRYFSFIVVWSHGGIDPCATRDEMCNVYNPFHKLQSNGTQHPPHPTTKPIFIGCNEMLFKPSFFLPLLLLPLTTTTASNIVLSNDDGWAEINIRAFYNALTAAGDSVVLSAPAENESGTGNTQFASFPSLETSTKKRNKGKSPPN